jgi:hypothetical protein
MEPQSATTPDVKGKTPQVWVKMMPNRNAPAAFATTARMILRNRLSERVWGCHGVHTLPITDRGLRLVCKRSLASGRSTGDRRFAYNWSQSGATTTSLLAHGQNAELAAQVAGGAAIGLAVITIGANDFADILNTSRSVAAISTCSRKRGQCNPESNAGPTQDRSDPL